MVEKKEEKRRLAYDKNAICKDGPDHEPHADPCTPGSVPAGKRTAAEKLQYVKKNWQLYVFFLLPALLLTIIFKYVPMGGVLIAFEDWAICSIPSTTWFKDAETFSAA